MNTGTKRDEVSSSFSRFSLLTAWRVQPRSLWRMLEPTAYAAATSQSDPESDESFGVPYGSRTRVAAVKGRCPRPLDERDAPW